ncbi:hypothetical protein GCM10011348_14170 [Marinobacterium nitratireducens]|uniref:Glycosyltransferase 2-like prokaryotic type domain-containing protein n=1 Tax=Marinobacterium nitratireducens TaxID=518897 RepID=A0A918DQ58_9GAMM|nr:glycosyltransferase [Marinobacterium nitratireducens]GGO79567.1 hypothetical protein GCM10011348_14170 [Marinobacterium nitratireducens]
MGQTDKQVKPDSVTPEYASATVHQASIVIPIRARKVTDDSLQRLHRLLETIPASFETIVVDDGSPKKVSAQLQTITAQRADACFYRLNTRWRRFSLARSRNRGARLASTPVVIFHDVDFIGMPAMYARIAEEIQLRELSKRPERFFCIPIGFLTEDATERFLQDLPGNQKLDRWSSELATPASSGLLQHFVKGSSCIVMNRDDLIAIGGHDETYDGHGAEDFELLHRLGERYPIGEKPQDYSLNTGSGPITAYRGFRAYFALYGEQVLEHGVTLVHLYHPKRKGWGYYQHKKNFAKLKRLMESDSQ